MQESTSGQEFAGTVVSSDSNRSRNDSSNGDDGTIPNGSTKVSNLSTKDQNAAGDVVNGDDQVGQVRRDEVRGQKVMAVTKNGGYENGVVVTNNGVRNIEELAEMLTKLNPMAAEFLPLSFASINGFRDNGRGFSSGIGFRVDENGFGSMGYPPRVRNSYQSKHRIKNRTSMGQREERIRRTVYVSDIDQQVTEEHLLHFSILVDRLLIAVYVVIPTHVSALLL